jgi:hypothetical protein
VLTRFKLTRSGTVTVTNLRVNFTTGGGVANGDVSACQLYSDVNSDGAVDVGDTLIQTGVTPVGGVITFTTNFTPGTSGTNYLVRCTVANLVGDDTTTFSVGTADIDEVETVTESGSISNATHTEDKTLTLADHAAGQEADKFAYASSVSGAELFAFKLTNNSASTVTVTQVQFQLSSVTGIVQGDFANLTIYVDANNDGAIGGGETTTVGGSGTVNAGVTTITFSTSFTIAASTTVNYILKGDVSNLVGNDKITLALTSGNVTVSGGSITGSTTGVTHSADYTLSLAEHAAGQEANKFTTTASVTGAELFAFKLTNNTASTQTVTQVQLQLSSVTGIVQGDFANLAIYVDANNDGAIGGGETTTVGGTGSVNAGVTTLTFSTSFTIAASTTVNYILKGDVSNLLGGDTFTLALGTSNITLQSGTMGGTALTTVTHSTYRYRKPITIDYTKVGAACGANLTNFPVLINISSDTDLRTTGNGGDVQSSSGYDILFTDGTGTVLDHEVEKYTASTGELVAWVRVPTQQHHPLPLLRQLRRHDRHPESDRGLGQ